MCPLCPVATVIRATDMAPLGTLGYEVGVLTCALGDQGTGARTV